MSKNKLNESEIRKIVSDSFDKSGLNPSLKDGIVKSATAMVSDQIKVASGEKLCDDKSFELSEDLLFKLLQ
jgi:hypothetical protein